ncbi:DUF4097 family beta strand repeat-containing protein [Nocardiopsis kunsanensis]|uniref:DUF4097 family beta strand repeat-containing protein n=1 Tax=Nocardiopsis kunsanensis TaxID=141693 RepID=UPI000348A983|nr:DUF4097 family beta strand repeat-containing protein [Nocardiopsis kunsanensis]
MKTFTTPTEYLDLLEIRAANLEVTVETEENLTEAVIELTGPEEILAGSSAERTATRWTLTIPAPEPTMVSGSGNVGIVAGNIVGGSVTISSGDLVVGGSRVTNTVASPGAGKPVRGTIRVPAGTDLTVPDLAHGSVTAPGTYGAVKVSSANAEIDIGHAREVEIEATNGDVAIGSASELIDVSTTNGDIDTGSAPRSRATSTNGDIWVLAYGDHRIRARTTNGDIDIARNGHARAEISTSTTNGRDRVR